MTNIIAITGSTGFIGSHLCYILRKEGYRVIELGRNKPETCRDEDFCYYDLSKPFEARLLSCKPDILIHAAYAPNDPEGRLNIEGTRHLTEAFDTIKGIRKIFLSSMAARPHSQSQYGKYKYEASKLFFNGERDIVLKTGLVIGNGGVFGRTMDFIRKTHLLILTNGGRQPLHFIGLKELGEVVVRLIQSGGFGHYMAASNDFVSFKQLYSQACQVQGIKHFTVPLPMFVMHALVGINQILPKPFVTKENLKGLKELNMPHDEEKIQQPGWQLPSLEETLRNNLSA